MWRVNWEDWDGFGGTATMCRHWKLGSRVEVIFTNLLSGGLLN